MQQLRSEWQEDQKEVHSVWKVGPLQIVQAVVHAQDEMYEKNLRDSWVLKAAVRNGILAYRPNPDTGKLEELLSQDWTSEAKLEFGTKRYPGEWLRDRLKWRDSEGVPKKPDWSLSKTAKEISDLQVWDYCKTCDPDAEDPEDLEISEALAEDLELELQNSLSLTISPALRRAGLRRLASAEYNTPEAIQKRKSIKKKRDNRKDWRKIFSGNMAKKVAERLKGQSREEALETLVPQAKPKQAAAKKKLKFCQVIKTNLKTKPSAKDKPCAQKKLLKKSKVKGAAKAAVEGEAGSMAQKKHQMKEALPPLPPPSEEPSAESDPHSEDPHKLLKQRVVVTSEEAGSQAYAKQGKLSSWSNKSRRYSMFSDSGTFSVKPEWVQLLSSKPEKNPVPFPKWSQLSRGDMSALLSQLNCLPQDSLGLDPTKEAIVHEVLQCHEGIPELEDQHIWLGWLLLRWKLRKSNLGSPEDSGFHCLDPATGSCIQHWKEKCSDGEIRRKAIEDEVRQSFTEKTQVLLVPVYAAHHWTLLVAERAEWGIEWRRYDSLSQEHKESHETQCQFGNSLTLSLSCHPSATQ